MELGRSREGAWIEMLLALGSVMIFNRRSREGAWIEMLKPLLIFLYLLVAPARERGLKYSCLAPFA